MYCNGIKFVIDFIISIVVFIVAIILVSCSADAVPEPIDISKVFETNLPVISINTKNRSINSKDSWITDVDLSINNNDETLSTSIKGRGNSSWNMPKKSYSIKLDKSNAILGMSKSKRWVLIANYADKSLIRNDFASYLGTTIFKNMDWNPSFMPVELILNNEYKGSYLIGEQIKIDEDRVRINDISKEEEMVNGGFIAEINARMDEDFNFKTSHGVCISLKDPDEVEPVIQDYVKSIIQHTEDVIFDDNFAEINQSTGKANYESVIDVDSFIDWYLVNEIAKNRDAKGISSIYLYYDSADKLIHMGPNWDFDIAFGNDGETECGDYKGWYIRGNIWFKQLMKDPVFKSKLKARWNYVYQDVLNAADEINNKAIILSKSADLNFKRWRILGKYTWPSPAGFFFRRTYQSEVSYLYNWYLNRVQWINEEIN